MSFLTNDGSILIDAVLTDEARRRLARNDGSARIVKFAAFDDEINYANYNSNHPSGSAYYDLEILQTPVFEGFSNNGSSAKSLLLSIPRTNLLYLPVVQINDVNSAANNKHAIGSYVVAVDQDTETSFANITGVLTGQSLNGGNFIRVDQGLDTDEIPPSFALDADLVETQYIIETDNRFGKIVSTSNTVAEVAYVDDDNIASYFLSLGTDSEFVSENQDRQDVSARQVISGPRGTILQFKLQASLELNTSTFLFNQLGTTGTLNSVSIRYIDSIITVRGATTGASVNVPIRFIKNQ